MLAGAISDVIRCAMGQLQGALMPVTCRTLAATLFVLVLAGCASTPPSPSQIAENDPYEATNRKVFALNEKLDKNVAKPVAEFYTDHVPEFARDGVHNFLGNLGMPVTFANDVLQGEALRAAQALGRFTFNSTFGIGGLIDEWAKTGRPEHTSDFGETLAVWGFQEGPYLVLPVLGPSDPRDAFGYGVDFVLDPSFWITFESSIYFYVGRGVVNLVDQRSQNLETLDQIERTSVDFYATMRSLYRQHRQAEINHGKPNIENLPNF
jgi:phospholipid-binding lipoprotein MlaA